MRRFLGLLSLFSILMLFPVSVHSQERVDSLCIYFRVNRFEIDSSFNENGRRMDAFAEKVRQGAENNEQLHFVINASASPEGGERPNEELALARAESLAGWLMEVSGVGRESIDIAFAGVGWTELRNLVLESGMDYCDEVADIIDNVPVFIFKGREIVDSRRKRLMELGMGNPYRFMLKNIFPQVRNARASVRCIITPADTVFAAHPLPEEESAETTLSAVPADTALTETPELTGPESPSEASGDAPEEESDETAAGAPEEKSAETAAGAPEEESAETAAGAPEEKSAKTAAGAPEGQQAEPAEETRVDSLSSGYVYVPQVKVKTNAVGLSMMMANAGVEIDIHPKLSVNIPIYYSGIDYFKQTVKFRFLGFQPELRYWPGPRRRLYAGFHLGVAFYNFAWGGEWRYQDKGGRTPTWGGGLGVGYRLPLDREERWNVEFTVGAGLYDLNYDRFYNVPNGPLESSDRKLFIGLDNVAVSFSYSFDMKKKGGDR